MSNRMSSFHRYLAPTLAFVLVFGAAMAIVALLMPNDRLLARFDPDGSPNGGFVEWEDLQKSWWTSLDQTSYEGGEPVTAARITRAFGNRYTITTTEAGGKTKTLAGKMLPDDSQSEHVIDPSASFFDKLLMEGKAPTVSEGLFETDINGRVIAIRSTESAVSTETTTISLDPPDDSRYHTAGQSLYHDDQLIAKRTYLGTVDAGTLGIRPQVIEDRDDKGKLLFRTGHSYSGNTRVSEVFDDAGNLSQSSKTTYDPFGRILSRQVYDSSGALLSEERYHYRFWERLLSIEGIWAGLLSLSLAATIASHLVVEPHKRREATNTGLRETSPQYIGERVHLPARAALEHTSKHRFDGYELTQLEVVLFIPAIILNIVVVVWLSSFFGLGIDAFAFSLGANQPFSSVCLLIAGIMVLPEVILYGKLRAWRRSRKH